MGGACGGFGAAFRAKQILLVEHSAANGAFDENVGHGGSGQWSKADLKSRDLEPETLNFEP
jgi:hypothetical protein